MKKKYIVKAWGLFNYRDKKLNKISIDSKFYAKECETKFCKVVPVTITYCEDEK